MGEDFPLCLLILSQTDNSVAFIHRICILLKCEYLSYSQSIHCIYKFCDYSYFKPSKQNYEARICIEVGGRKDFSLLLLGSSDINFRTKLPRISSLVSLVIKRGTILTSIPY